MEEHGDLKNLIREAYAPPKDIKAAAMERIKEEQRKKKLYLRMSVSAAAVVVIGCVAIFAARIPFMGASSDAAMTGYEMEACDIMLKTADEDYADTVYATEEAVAEEAPVEGMPARDENGIMADSAESEPWESEDASQTDRLADELAGMNGVLGVETDKHSNMLAVTVEKDAPETLIQEILAMAEGIAEITIEYD